LHILLAEDNAVNQTLALFLLEKQGHTVFLAGDGKQALAAWEQQPFDLILMDVQMPEMDGFEATHRIREIEKGTARHIPIIAMTAHAMKGDRERCLAAGMDGYVAKPVQSKELAQAIGSLVPAASGIEADVPGAEPAEMVLDRAAVLKKVRGNVDQLRKLVEVFQQECPKLLTEIHDALFQGEARKLGRAAHSLKGAMGIFGASAACNTALKLESMGRTGDLTGAEEVCVDLEKELDRLQPLLAAWVAQESSG
jgi:CheY-like chemotaxis protein/HPt (histidine-containing phosphotransfer) domain-containing protein